MEWISIGDRMPETCGDYLVTDGECQMVAYFNPSGVWDFFDNHGWWDGDDVIHWMPLPETPKPNTLNQTPNTLTQ